MIEDDYLDFYDPCKIKIPIKLFDEGDVPDGKISPNDELTIITNRVGRRFNVVWEITFSEPDLIEAILPDGGDVAFIAIAKPFSESDTFRFRTLTEYITVDEFSDNLQPEEFRLLQNYPNPFNAWTSIEYELAEATKVEVKIYNILGREIITLITGDQSKGVHRIRWDGFDKQNKRLLRACTCTALKPGDL